MLSHATKLFINGLPVDYFINSDGTVFHFEPFFNPHHNIEAPHFTIIKQGDSYVFKSVEEEAVKDQAVEDLERLFFHN